jgi:nitrite reductase (NO-forming)/hydroxylamine reductase
LKKYILLLILFACTVFIAACNSEATPSPETDQVADQEDASGLAAAFVKGGCGGCHVIPGLPGAEGTVGPNLSEIGAVAQGYLDSGEYSGQAGSPQDFIYESLVSPNAFVPTDCPGGHCQEGLMPPNFSDLLSEQELQAITSFLASLPADPEQIAAQLAATQAGQAPELTDEEWAKATQIFFDRCAGCHGVLRNGATGPALTPDKTIAKGTLALSSIIFNGTPRGMPDWGKQGVLDEQEAELMAKFVQNEPPQPPEMSLQQMLDSWQVFTPPEDRPTSPQHDRDWQNFFAVTLRDAGQVAIIDGDTFDVVNYVNTGYAVHISRMSATGRYVYTIGRDGKLALIDLWMEVPDKVAEVQTCYDARSVEVSKYVGEEGDFSDKYAIVGCYWPPHFVIMDGETLEPFKIVSTRSYTYDNEE